MQMVPSSGPCPAISAHWAHLTFEQYAQEPAGQVSGPSVRVFPEDRVSSPGRIRHWGVWDASVSIIDGVGSYEHKD